MLFRSKRRLHEDRNKNNKSTTSHWALFSSHRGSGIIVCIRANTLIAATGEVLQGTIEEQTKLVLDNIGEILLAGGLNYANVVKTTVFLTDLADFAAVNGVYGSYFQEQAPARSCVQVAALPKGVKIEIEVIAVSK